MSMEGVKEKFLRRCHLPTAHIQRLWPSCFSTQSCIALTTMDNRDILDKVQEAIDLTCDLLQRQHTVQTTIKCHNLSSALSALSAALSHTTTVLGRIGAAGVSRNALLDICNVLSDSTLVLSSQLHALADPTGRTLHDGSHRLLPGMVRQPRRLKCRPKICESTNAITTNLIKFCDLLDMPDLNSWYPSHRHCAADDPKHQAKAPVPDSEYDHIFTVLPTGLQTDQENQDKHVHFAVDPPDLIVPLPRSMVTPAELSASHPVYRMSARELCPTDIYRQHGTAQELHSLSGYPGSSAGAADECGMASRNVSSSETDDEYLPPLKSPSLAPTNPPSPPPPYSPWPQAASDYDTRSLTDNLSESGITATPRTILDLTDLSDEEPDEVWTDPITLGCRRTMRQRFPTTTPAIYTDYLAYREQVRNSSTYKWYLDFRYLSLTLQSDLPMQAFMVDMRSCVMVDGRATTQATMRKVLAYLFEDCIVFAQLPLASSLPDLNATTSRCVSLIGDSGLEVLEHQSLRFCHVRRAIEVDETAMLIECSHNSNARQTQHQDPRDHHTPTLPQTRLVHVTFQTTCQRRKVLQPLKPWIEEDLPQHTHEDDEIAHHCHHNYSHCRRHNSSQSRSQSHSHLHHCIKKHNSHRHHQPNPYQWADIPDFRNHSYIHDIHDAFTPRHHRCAHHNHTSQNMRTEFYQTSNEGFSAIALEFTLPVRLSRSGIF